MMAVQSEAPSDTSIASRTLASVLNCGNLGNSVCLPGKFSRGSTQDLLQMALSFRPVMMFDGFCGYIIRSTSSAAMAPYRVIAYHLICSAHFSSVLTTAYLVP